MKNIYFLIITIFVFGMNYGLAEVISMRTDTWCPYACDPKSRKPGFMVEIAQEVFKKHGHTIDYDVMNWARAITEVKTGKYVALIGCSKSDVEGFVIPKNPAGAMISYYYTAKNETWMYAGEKSLIGKKIGVINNYTYGDEIDKLVNKKNNIFVKVAGENPLLRIIQMTETKRLDGFVENPVVLDYTLANMKKDKNNFKIASANLANDPELFIAFSPANKKSSEYARMLDEGIDELRRNGRLKVILAKYGLSDWKK